MMRFTFICALPLLIATPAFGQSMDSMPGMAMPAAPKAAPKKPVLAKPKATPEAKPKAPAVSTTGAKAPPDQSLPTPTMSDTNVPVVTESAMDAPAPPAPKDFAADRYFDPQIMATARAQLKQEHGGSTYSMVLVNIAEYAPRKGVDSYRWEGEAWHGGDINRLVVKSEGEGDTRHLGRAEIQVLYSRAIGPYFNLQAGLRYDIRPTPNRTYATIGFEGLAPYMFEVGGALFVSNKGDVLGRLDAFEDFRITQRFIVQPRAELNFAASDVSETGIGSGLSDSELGMRLRYEVRREFAPYLGVSWDQKYGRTQDLARAAGENPSSVRFVGGLRVWF